MRATGFTPPDSATARRWSPAAVFAVAFSGLLVVWLLLRPVGEGVVVLGNNVANMAGPLVACWWCLRPGGGRGVVSGPVPGRSAWACLTAGMLLVAVGQVLWHGYELLHGVPAFPSWIDGVYFAAYPCLLAGVLLLPVARHSLLARGRVLAETAMTTAALATFAWYFVLGPITLGHARTTAETVVALGYPVGDLLVLFGLLFTCSLAAGDRLRGVILPLLAGLATLAAADATFASQILRGTYRAARPLHAAWPFGYMMIGLAAAGLRAGRARGLAADADLPAECAPRAAGPGPDSESSPPFPLWRSLVPYALVALTGVLLAYTRAHGGDEPLERGVEVGAAVIIALVFLRQLLESRECSRLYGRLRQAFERADGTNRSLAEANASLADANQFLRSRDALLQGTAAAANHLLAEPDLDAAVAAALRAIGQAAAVDRVYVFQNHWDHAADRRLTSQRYEWCAAGVRPQIDNPALQGLAYAGLARWERALAAGRPYGGPVAHFPDAERPLFDALGVQSALCVPIMLGGEFWGFVGFDDCRRPRAWGEGEVSILTTVAAAIAGALARQKTQSELQHDSLHDALTGLPNRLLFADRVTQALERARRRDDYRFAVLFLDLDRFKVINDSLGHAVGDKLLIAAAERLSRCVRGNDSVATRGGGTTSATRPLDHVTTRPLPPALDGSVARLGGDEFTILLDDLAGAEDAVRVARRILAELNRPFAVDGHEVFTTASIGIVDTGPGLAPHTTAADLLRDADAAMYRAKTAGKARYAVFDASMHHAAVARLRLESDLRRAIERNELTLYYQPIVCLDSGRLVGFEALVRWRRGDRLVSPADFIPVAEDTGLIVPVGEWVLEQACRQLAAWRGAHPAAAAPLTMSVNLSRRQLGDARLLPHLQRVLDDTRIGPASLRLEITETVVMDDAEGAGLTLDKIKRIGVELSMDDFGTGYSSLSCLHRFPIDVLKLDRGFLTGSADQRDVAAVVQAIVGLAHNLGMKVVAEGLEHIEQVAFVQALECDFGQGYVFAKPMPAQAAEEFMLAPVALAASA